MKNFKYPIFTILAFCIIISCEKEEEPKTSDITYTNTIKNDLATCATADCHVSGFAFGSYENHSDTKATINVGRTIGALKHSAGFFPMPKDLEKWSDSKIARLETWIDDGMPE